MSLQRTSKSGKPLMGGRKGGPPARPPGDPNRVVDADIAKRKQKFLDAYRKDGTVSGACRIARVGRATHYKWLKMDPEYAKGFAEAHEDAVDTAESELRRRGIHGTPEPVYYKGEVVGSIQRYSDPCLIFYLKGRRSDVFKDRSEIDNRHTLEVTIMERLAAGRRRLAPPSPDVPAIDGEVVPPELPEGE